MSIALLLIWWLVMDLAAQIIETLAVWTLTHHQPRLYPAATWLCALSPVAIDPLRTRPRLTGSLLIGSAAILTAVGRVTVLVLANYYTSLEASCTSAGARAPGSSSPLVRLASGLIVPAAGVW